MKKIRWFYLQAGHRLTGPALLFSLLLVALSAALVQADNPNRVALVVVHGDGDIIKQCIEFSENELTGMQLLQRSGLDLNVDVNGGMGGAVCRIDSEGCTYPADDCFCRCEKSDNCVYWSYWYQKDGDWQFSGLGAANLKVKNGDMQGWVWGKGTIGSAGTKPPAMKFEDVCTLPPTSTPTATPSSTATPTNTPTVTPTPKPTDTPEPTDTPKPVATPVIHSFSANRTAINAGEQVVLSWDLSDAEAAYLHYNGREEGVVSPGSKTVSPGESMVYTLVAKNEGGETSASVSISVNGAPPPPTPTPTPPPPATPVAVAGQAAAPTATSAPPPQIDFRAASTELPPGACTNVEWSVAHASAVYLDDVPVDGQGQQQVCPTQTQTVRLRAVYPGGEKNAELVLAVTENLVVVDDTATPAAANEAAEPTLPATPPAATPAALAVAADPADSPRPQPRRFTVPAANSESDSTGHSVLWGAGIILVIGFFVVAPVALLVAGWVTWWLRGKKP